MDLEEKREDLDQLTPALSAVEQAIGKTNVLKAVVAEEEAAVEVAAAEALQVVIGMETDLWEEMVVVIEEAEETSEIEMTMTEVIDTMIETEATREEDLHQDPHQEEDTAHQEETDLDPEMVDMVAEETEAIVVVADTTIEMTTEITEEVHQEETSIEATAKTSVIEEVVAASEEIEAATDSETTIEEVVVASETEMTETMIEEVVVLQGTVASEMIKRESWKKEDALSVAKKVTWLETAPTVLKSWEIDKINLDSDLNLFNFKHIQHYCCKVINF